MTLFNCSHRKEEAMCERASANINLQTVQRGADYPRGLGLTGQLEGQHIFVRLNVVGSGWDYRAIPAGVRGEQSREPFER